jgi:predicted outer membrane repeat protein
MSGCRFVNNNVSTTIAEPLVLPYGAAFGVLGGTHTITNCEVIGNSSTDYGGGVLLAGIENITMTNCVFSRNSAGFLGGAILMDSTDVTAFVNCTFSRNTCAGAGGALAVSQSHFTAANSIFWGNTAHGGTTTDETAQIFEYLEWGPSTFDVTYSCIQDADPADASIYVGAGNIDDNPLLANAAGDDLRLLDGSPCIDAADNGAVPADTADLDGDGDLLEPLPLDLDGLARFADVFAVADTGSGTAPIVDMGAYEVPAPVPGDFDGDGDIDADDVEYFGGCRSGPTISYAGGCAICDLDLDGDVDQTDFARLQRCCSGENIPADPGCAE